MTENVRARQTVAWDLDTVAGGVKRTEVGPGKAEPLPRMYHAGCGRGGQEGRSVPDLREASTGKQPEGELRAGLAGPEREKGPRVEAKTIEDCSLLRSHHPRGPHQIPG